MRYVALNCGDIRRRPGVLIQKGVKCLRGDAVGSGALHEIDQARFDPRHGHAEALGEGLAANMTDHAITDRLTEAGIYCLDDFAFYLNDPAPQPSLDNSIAKALLKGCPRRAWWLHPRLNPRYAAPPSTSRQIQGTVAHYELTGKGKAYRIVEADDYKSKVARAERDGIEVSGLVPIVRPQYEAVRGMILELRRVLPDIDGGTAFNSEFGEMEACALAMDARGCWIRCLIDFYGHAVPSGVTAWDYKTVSGDANPYSIMAHATASEWAMQAAFQDRVLTTLRPNLAGKISYRFLVQEVEPPYLVSIAAPSASALELSRRKVDFAITRWARCLRENDWPGYTTNIVEFNLLPSAEASWLAREVNDPQCAPEALPLASYEISASELPPPKRQRRAPRRRSRLTPVPIIPGEETPF